MVTFLPAVHVATGAPASVSISTWWPLQGNGCWLYVGYSPFRGMISSSIGTVSHLKGGGFPMKRWQTDDKAKNAM